MAVLVQGLQATLEVQRPEVGVKSRLQLPAVKPAAGRATRRVSAWLWSKGPACWQTVLAMGPTAPMAELATAAAGATGALAASGTEAAGACKPGREGSNRRAQVYQ